ncbi:substrate-binding domain-containing protein, partial [Glycomyces tenuis]|uniref:substrate-binding domain-containing protein n=1 Tax=Glycomyces tenuis TaxID=58116 RepID=UPI000557EFFE
SQCGGVAGGPQVLFFPFATDDLRYVVNGDNQAVGEFPGDSAGTNAPLDLTTAEMIAIYTCDATQWSDLRSELPAETINPLAPQDGSGTRQAFLDSLQLDTFGSCVDDTVQEHDALPVDGDPNAIAPFSVGRFNTEVPADANGDKPGQGSTGCLLYT